MVWRNYIARYSGVVKVRDDHSALRLRVYEMGIILTGRSRVFAGYYIRLRLPGDAELSGEDAHTLRAALWRLASNLSAVEFELQCVGLDPRWRESGLSADTGWGYIVGNDAAIHMMDPAPPTAAEEDVNGLIIEAVKGMKIGIRNE